jgi:1-phosphatidylinositol-4-phosphate 5-kinase
VAVIFPILPFEKASKARLNDPSLLGKDQDWEGTLPFSLDVREALSRQFIEDAEFLAQQNIMDYSVLVGIAHLPTDLSASDLVLAEHPRYRRLFSPDERTLYFVGIIDMMQLYDFNKRLERFYKVRLIRKDPDGVSVLPPGPYCRRFSHMCLRIAGLDKPSRLSLQEAC